MPDAGPATLRSRLGAAKRRFGDSRRADRHVDPPIRHDLSAWAASWPGADYSVLDPATVTNRPLPKTIEAEVDASFAPLSTFPVPERALVKIPKGRVSGESGLVVLPNGEFVGELIAMTPDGQHTMLREHADYYEPQSRRVEFKAGNYYPVLGLGVTHYYHWSHDIIMRMRGIAGRLPSDTHLIVPERMRSFQTETLALLGLEGHAQVPIPADALWELENLYVVKPTLKTQIDSSEPYQWFRDAAMTRYGISEVQPTRRLYLSRSDATHWRTTNESEVEAVLSQHGFETVAPGGLSFREQVALFGQADTIVGTGAGLMNMIFAPPGVQVLQFQDPNHMVHALWTMAAAMGFDYHYVLCEPVANPGTKIADMQVPIDKLNLALAHLTASRAA